MNSIFIDTGAFYGLEVARDQCHLKCAHGWHRLRDEPLMLFSSHHVLHETIELLARRVGPKAAAERLETYAAGGQIVWLEDGPADWLQAAELMRKFADQKISFIDCLSFALMNRERIENVFGFDRHFEQAGFALWPADHTV